MARKPNPNHFGYAAEQDPANTGVTMQEVQSFCQQNNMSVDEVATCLSENGLLGDCGSLYGSKLVLFNGQCRLSKSGRDGLNGKGGSKWISVDYTFYDTVAVGGLAKVSFFPEPSTAGARAVGVRNIERAKIAETADKGAAAILKMRLLYGEDLSVTPTPFRAFYGREKDTNIAAGTAKYRSLDIPPQIRNGEFSLKIAKTTIFEYNALSAFDTTGRANDLRYGEILLDNPQIINGGERLEMDLEFPEIVVAPSTGEAYLRIELIGSFAFPIGKA